MLMRTLYQDLQDSGHAAASQLQQTIDAALVGVRASAAIAISRPAHGARVTLPPSGGSSGGTLVVEVQLVAFELPADGMWCLRANGVELSCVGDNIKVASLPLPLSPEVMAAAPSGSSNGGGRNSVVVLQAVLRAGLERADVVRFSPDVVVHIA